MSLYHKPHLVILFIMISTCLLHGQGDEKQKEISGHFIFKEHWVISQKYSNTMGKRESESLSALRKSIPNIPTPPSVAVFDRNKSIHFLISSDKFIYYAIPDEFENDSTVSFGVSGIFKIDRETKKMTRFSPWNFELFDGYKIPYQEDDRFELLEENKTNKREIDKFICFQVLLKDTNTNLLVEMYVTEEINLDFHPVFNVKKYLDNYYPLYIKSYDPEFPEDYYKERTFFRYK